MTPEDREAFAQYLYDETHPLDDLSAARGIFNSVLITLAGLILGYLCASLLAP